MDVIKEGRALLSSCHSVLQSNNNAAGKLRSTWAKWGGRPRVTHARFAYEWSLRTDSYPCLQDSWAATVFRCMRVRVRAQKETLKDMECLRRMDYNLCIKQFASVGLPPAHRRWSGTLVTQRNTWVGNDMPSVTTRDTPTVARMRPTFKCYYLALGTSGGAMWHHVRREQISSILTRAHNVWIEMPSPLAKCTSCFAWIWPNKFGMLNKFLPEDISIRLRSCSCSCSCL